MAYKQLDAAAQGIFTEEMNLCAEYEGIDVSILAQAIKDGSVIVPKNIRRRVKRPCAIGKGCLVKVNANVGTSPDVCKPAAEKEKIIAAQEAGADCVMDLSIAGDLQAIRHQLIEVSEVPFGTVPIYEAAAVVFKEGGDIDTLTIDMFLKVIERQAKDGVDFFTVHAGLTKRAVEKYVNSRVMGIVSRGGALLSRWIRRNKKENLLYEHFDEILDIMAEYDVAMSLGDGLRPGSIFDAGDRAQMDELIVLGELAQRCRERGVQVMIEGPGHVPLDMIKAQMEIEKAVCSGAPFYVLGPLPTDIAAGFDHIAGAIGGALAGMYGADMLCYVTPSEHLRHPSREDVIEGVVGIKVAAHCADIARRNPSALAKDKAMSTARMSHDWQGQFSAAILPERAKAIRESSLPQGDNDVCTMCGDFCALKQFKE